MKPGRALRQAWALERAAAVPCPCGHPTGEHFERRPTFTVEDGTVIETWPVDFRPGLFFCAHCACSTRA